MKINSNNIHSKIKKHVRNKRFLYKLMKSKFACEKKKYIKNFEIFGYVEMINIQIVTNVD